MAAMVKMLDTSAARCLVRDHISYIGEFVISDSFNSYPTTMGYGRLVIKGGDLDFYYPVLSEDAYGFDMFGVESEIVRVRRNEKLRITGWYCRHTLDYLNPYTGQGDETYALWDGISFDEETGLPLVYDHNVYTGDITSLNLRHTGPTGDVISAHMDASILDAGDDGYAIVEGARHNPYGGHNCTANTDIPALRTYEFVIPNAQLPAYAVVMDYSGFFGYPDKTTIEVVPV